MKHNNLKGSLILTFASVIWGLAFVAQSDAAKLIPSYTFNSIRSFIGALALLIFYLFTNRKEKKSFVPKEKGERKTFFTAMIVCGILLTISINFQQFGLAFYPAGVASEARGGFLTALYVILVPIMSVFIGKKINPFIWVSVIIAMIGIYLLCFSGGVDGIYFGDLLLFLCAVSFSFHILSIDKFVDSVGGVRLSIIQFTVCGILSGIMGLCFEKVSIEPIISALPQILYLGIMSSGVAYTLQIVGQKFAEPSVASLSMSLESVFAALGGWLISGNVLKGKEILGCVIVFSAIVLAQIPDFIKKPKKEKINA